eukprot:365855-Chlamydomonas_euryale.AAC.7
MPSRGPRRSSWPPLQDCSWAVGRSGRPQAVVAEHSWTHTRYDQGPRGKDYPPSLAALQLASLPASSPSSRASRLLTMRS